MKRLLPVAMFLLLAGNASAAKDLLPATASHVRHTVDDLTEFDVAMTPLQVDAFYRKALAAKGWKLGDTVNYGTTLVLDFRKAPKAAGRLTVAPTGPGRTHVTLSISQ
jgi:hypothetical protein